MQNQFTSTANFAMRSLFTPTCRHLQRAGVLLAVLASPVQGDEVRFFKDNQGITYREDTRTAQLPSTGAAIPPSGLTPAERGLAPPAYVAPPPPSQAYTTYVPATQYQWVPRWHGWWRLFEGPHIAYHLEPQTVWYPRTVTAPSPYAAAPNTSLATPGPVASTPPAILPPPTASMAPSMPSTGPMRPSTDPPTASRELVFRTPVAGPSPELAARTWAPTYRPYDPYGSVVYLPPTPPARLPMNPSYFPPAPQVVPPPWPSTSGYGGIARLESDPPRAGMVSPDGWRPQR